MNGRALAGKLVEGGSDVRIPDELDAVDLARDTADPPAGYDQDLSQMLKDLIAKNVTVKVCGTCMARCVIYKNQPYFDGAEKSTMQAPLIGYRQRQGDHVLKRQARFSPTQSDTKATSTTAPPACSSYNFANQYPLEVLAFR